MKYNNVEIIPIPKAVLEEYNGLTNCAKFMYIQWFTECYLGVNNIKEYIERISDIGDLESRKALKNLIDSGYLDVEKYELRTTTDYKYDTHYGVFRHKYE